MNRQEVSNLFAWLHTPSGQDGARLGIVRRQMVQTRLCAIGEVSPGVGVIRQANAPNHIIMF